MTKSLLSRVKWQLKNGIGQLSGDREWQVNWNQVYWVAPQRITFCTLSEFDNEDNKGQIIAGNWDRLEKKFEDLDVYVAFRQVCLEGKSWAETVFYQRHVAEINRGRILWDCQNQSDFDRRCQELELLFATIKQTGYKSQRDLKPAQSIIQPIQFDEVAVSIGRHGDLLFSDGGAHRLAIAKLLDLPAIPVEILVRHPEWVRFKKELRQYARELGGKTYQPALHPDLADIPALHSCEDRFAMIQAHLSAKRGYLLDIGANLGYFCHRFEDAGFTCYALEDHPTNLHFLEKLKRAENKTFKTIAKSALEYDEIKTMHFDVVLALNIFHHFLKTKEGYEKLLDFLHCLQTQELFFGSHCPDEEQMQMAYRNYSPSEFAEFVAANSNLNKVECIGGVKDGRTLYHLSK